MTANAASHDVSVHVNRGDGVFAAERRFAVGEGPYAVLVADVDSDGSPDVVTANSWDHNVTVLPGDGEGGFGQAIDADYFVGDIPNAKIVPVEVGDREPPWIVADREHLARHDRVGRGLVRGRR